jgi:hypothetical protein
MSTDFSPSYYAYVGLLRRLHGLIAEGRGDSETADAVRDEMDDPWARLTPQELDAANRLSAQLERDPSPPGVQPTGGFGSRVRVRAKYSLPRKAAA